MYRNGKKNSNSVQALASVKQERDENGDLHDSNSLSPAPSGSPTTSGSTSGGWPFLKTNRLLLFCDIVLAHVNYPHAFLDQSNSNNNSTSNDSEDGEQGESESAEENKGNTVKNERVAESPLNSVGESARESIRSSTSSTESIITEMDPEEVDKETFESVTCWCGKPFAGRPMIECDICLVWYHLKCENVKKNCIPNEFHCSRCKDKKKRKKRPSPSGKDSSRKPAKRMNLEPVKASSQAPAIPISPSTSSIEASSRLNEAPTNIVSSATSTLQVQSSKQSVTHPGSNGLKVGDDVKESNTTQVNSQPVAKKTKGKSLSPSRVARPKKAKKDGKDERRKSSGGALVTSTVMSPSANPNDNGISHLSARLALPCDDYQPNGEVNVSSSQKWPAVGCSSASTQSQMPPVLPCYGSVGGNSTSKSLLTQNSSSRQSYEKPHGTPFAGNNYDGGFSSPIASIPVLQPEVTTNTPPQHQSVIMGPGIPPHNSYPSQSHFPNQETGEGSPTSSPSSSAYIQPPSFLESSSSYPSQQQQMGQSSINPVSVHHPYNHHNDDYYRAVFDNVDNLNYWEWDMTSCCNPYRCFHNPMY